MITQRAGSSFSPRRGMTVIIFGQSFSRDDRRLW